ncbi:response regulator transcription factor [Fusibacter sp. JL216-2]|uniref:response regulator transcription factor n=1 Tax=Fusibacter sp. JL216-2 TaxID=3071453 RepID=UPI003D349B10
MAKILIIDDDKNIVSMISDFMHIHNIETQAGHSGQDAIDMSKDPSIDLIVLDINMKGIDGFEACKRIRQHSSVPIIFLTAKTTQSDKILGLGIGADDYLTKPFDPLELVARVKSNLRRVAEYTHNSRNDILESGSLALNLATHQVKIDGKQLDLSATEYTLLVYLFKNSNRILSRKELLKNVWNSDIYTENTVNTYIMRLREKIEINKHEPHFLITIRGEGYIFRTQ